MITEKSLKILLENNGIADAKQKLYNKDIVEQLRQKGWEPVNSGSDKKYNKDSRNFEDYNYIQLRPIGKKFFKDSVEERVEVNLRTGKCKLMAMMKDKPEYEEPDTYKYNLPADVKTLCGKLRHSMQANFRSVGKKAETSATFKKTIENLKKKRIELLAELKSAKENGASEKEIKKIEDERQKISEKILDLEGFLGGNNIYQKMLKNGLKNDAKIDKRIALANASKKLEESVIAEGSHHSKYPPAVNYKYVNNYLIKARKALKEGKIEEADKLAWRACSLMHEDEMQGPGVSADKNAYNIFHKQLGNIQNAIIAARKANKESN